MSGRICLIMRMWSTLIMGPLTLTLTFTFAYTSTLTSTTTTATPSMTCSRTQRTATDLQPQPQPQHGHGPTSTATDLHRHPRTTDLHRHTDACGSAAQRLGWATAMGSAVKRPQPISISFSLTVVIEWPHIAFYYIIYIHWYLKLNGNALPVDFDFVDFVVMWVMYT